MLEERDLDALSDAIRNTKFVLGDLIPCSATGATNLHEHSILWLEGIAVLKCQLLQGQNSFRLLSRRILPRHLQTHKIIQKQVLHVPYVVHKLIIIET